MEYKVITSLVRHAEENMNEYAKEGWRVLTVCPDKGMGYGVVITFVRDK